MQELTLPEPARLNPHIARRRYGLDYLVIRISESKGELAKLEKYCLCLIGFSKNLASHFDRSPLFRGSLAMAMLLQAIVQTVLPAFP